MSTEFDGSAVDATRAKRKPGCVPGSSVAFIARPLRKGEKKDAVTQEVRRRRVDASGLCMTKTGDVAALATDHAYPKRWLSAVVMMGAATMDLIDVTVVNVALPTIRRDLGASGAQLEWTISAYMLGFAAALIVAGSFGDLLGRKRVFLLGIALFGLASLAAGLAQDPEQLIAARVVQGVAAAAMIPQLLATFRAIFDGQERGKAFGIYGAVLGFASAIGLVLGGVLTQADLFGWGWRTVFFVNIPVAIVTLIATIRVVPESSDPEAG